MWFKSTPTEVNINRKSTSIKWKKYIRISVNLSAYILQQVKSLIIFKQYGQKVDMST